MSNSSDIDMIFKILVIGDPNVGKTSIVHRYTSDLFTEKYKATIGVDFALKTVLLSNIPGSEPKKVYLQLWDLAGQERVKQLTRVYYEGAAGIFLVFDVSSIQSLDSIKSWYSVIRESLQETKIPIFLLANKCDLIPPAPVESKDNHALKRLPKVYDKVIKFHEEGLFDTLYEVSARTGTGVEEAGMAMAQLLYSRHSVTKNPEKLLLTLNKKEKPSRCC